MVENDTERRNSAQRIDASQTRCGEYFHPDEDN
jgi:hypothetical protein